MKRQTTFTDLSIREDVVNAAGALLGNDVVVSKPVRAGVTTSLIIAAARGNLKVVYVAPTNRIIKETVKNAADLAGTKPIRIPANTECPKVKDNIAKCEILGQLPMMLPNCDKCDNLPGCQVKAIMHEENPNLITLTYNKLAALMYSTSTDSKTILDTLAKADVIILDECHYLSKINEVQVPALDPIMPNIPKIPEGYPKLQSICEKWGQFLNTHMSTIINFLIESKDYATKWSVRPLMNPDTITDLDMREGWGELANLAIRSIEEPGLISENDILTMRDIITIMRHTDIKLLYNSDTMGVMVAVGHSEMVDQMKLFLNGCGAKANHIYVSGTTYEPHPGYFSELSGKPLEQAVFPDIRHSNASLTLIPSKWKVTSWNFDKELPRILETIRLISEQENHQPIRIFTLNKEMKGVISDGVKAMGLENIKVDYYRSSLSMGVEASERIGIMIGMAETPVNSCDAAAKGNSMDELWADSRSIRLQAVQADTWQAINRVKDPNGEVPSRVYCIGCRVGELLQLSKWGAGRRADLIEVQQGKNGGKHPVFNIVVDQSIEPVTITGERKNTDNPKQRSVDNYIAEVMDYYNSNFINSENPVIFSTNISGRENNRKLGIYNNYLNNNQIGIAETLHSTFINRTDAFAEQFGSGESASWSKKIGACSIDHLMEHLQGKRTFGSYEIGLDDTVIWGCLDIDDHGGKNPHAQADVQKVIEVLNKYKVPFLLEASGSPNSYHIWIFFKRTKTYNAYVFMRQIVSEAGIKCEIFPKQKALNKDSRYGNQVKIPLGINRKTGARSQFLDPLTFEPLEGEIRHPGLVRLVEVPELTPTAKVYTMPNVLFKAGRDDNELDPCMKGLLADKVPLEGSEGHEMRVAIAAKATMAGFELEKIVGLYADQPDFNREITFDKVMEIRERDYEPYSCQVLKDRCGSLVEPYCQGCKWRSKAV